MNLYSDINDLRNNDPHTLAALKKVLLALAETLDDHAGTVSPAVTRSRSLRLERKTVESNGMCKRLENRRDADVKFLPEDELELCLRFILDDSKPIMSALDDTLLSIMKYLDSLFDDKPFTEEYLRNARDLLAEGTGIITGVLCFYVTENELPKQGDIIWINTNAFQREGYTSAYIVRAAAVSEEPILLDRHVVLGRVLGMASPLESW